MNQINYIQLYQMLNRSNNLKFFPALDAISYGNINKGLYDGYKNYKPRKLSEKYMIYAYHFAIIDLGLYLDTHPDDSEALNLYKEYVARYNDLVKKSNKPLTLTSEKMTNEFTWVKDFLGDTNV